MAARVVQFLTATDTRDSTRPAFPEGLTQAGNLGPLGSTRRISGPSNVTEMLH